MPKVPVIIPISDLRQDAAGVLEQVRKSAEPVVITQRGRAAAVLLSVERYEELARAHELLESGATPPGGGPATIGGAAAAAGGAAPASGPVGGAGGSPPSRPAS